MCNWQIYLSFPGHAFFTNLAAPILRTLLYFRFDFYFFLGNPLHYSFLSGTMNFVRCCYETTPFPIMLLSPAQTSTLPIASGEGSPLNALRKHREKGKGPLVSYISPVLFVKKPLRCQAKQDVTRVEFFGT